MKETDYEIAELLEEAYDCLGKEAAELTVYNFRINSLRAQPCREAGYELVEKFNAFCDSHGGIEYFAVEMTLQGAVVYKDFMPGEFDITVGMTRDEYLRLEKAFEADPPEDLALDAFMDHKRTARQMNPVVTLKHPAFIKEDGHFVYDDGNMPLQANPLLVISIFDVVPKDYDVSRAFYYQLRILNRQFERRNPAQQLPMSKMIWRVAGSYNKSGHDVVCKLFPTRGNSISLKKLRPVKRLPFGTTEIMCPRVTTPWVVEQQDSMLEQVKCLQKDALKIAVEIDRICRANNIGYFICGGTMLGYVRHGGFIPWDDDIDVGMLREDYEKFLEVAPAQLGEEFFLQTRKSDPNIPYLFSKIRLHNTEYITAYNEFRDFEKGICVDIFPFDRAPIGDWRMTEHKKKVDGLIREHNSTANRQVPSKGLPNKKASNPVEALEQAVMQIRHKRNWNKSLVDTQEAYDNAVTSFNSDESLKFVASYVATFTCVHLDDLLPYRDINFEGATLKVPNHPEIFLQMQYGDFMLAPPLDQQQGHGLLRWKGTEKSSKDFN